jgi:hypothetical protein
MRFLGGKRRKIILRQQNAGLFAAFRMSDFGVEGERKTKCTVMVGKDRGGEADFSTALLTMRL